jgi:alpha-beta hydrolase superfamily lysophospholipase
MDLRTLRSLLKYIFVILSTLALVRHAVAQTQPTPGVTFGGGKNSSSSRKNNGQKTKTIHGMVEDTNGNPLDGAHILVRDTKSNVTRTLTTGSDGLYGGTAFPASSDYEVTAEYHGQTSDKKLVSSFLDREDNVLNFRFKAAAEAATPNTSARAVETSPPGPQINTFDLVRLQATLDFPSGVQAPFPAVLLLHGFGEDRSVWNDFKKTLLTRGLAVMTLDLRGHGDSKTKNGQTIAAVADWRTSPHEFPLDLDAAITWLKTQTRINSNKIAVIGVDVGANLALIASGRYQQVRTVVAVNPNLTEGQELAGSAQDYKPRSALILALTEAQGNTLKTAVQPPVQVRVVAQTGGTASWLQNKQVSDAIYQWLKDSF